MQYDEFTNPHITTENMLEELFILEPTKETDIRARLGQSIASINVLDLQKVLLESKILSKQSLSHLIGAVSGLDVFHNDGADVKENLSKLAPLPIEVARTAGALKVSDDPLKIAFIEDAKFNLEVVNKALNGEHFEVMLISGVDFQDLFKVLYKKNIPNNLRVVETNNILELLEETVSNRGSDLHLTVGSVPILRVDGTLVPLKREVITKEWLSKALFDLAGESRYKTWERNKDVDFAYQYGQNRFRCNIGEDLNGITLAARLLPRGIPTPDGLGMPKAIRDFIHLDRGLVLITGPTGSGKSTTLATLMNQIALTQARHIITLEDPIEFLLPQGGMSVVHQRELGASFLDFAGGIRQALRQDPDVVLVGELRDQETMRTAITCAETGHLVFSTLHTYDSVSTVARLVNSFSGGERDAFRAQLAYILKGIVSQTLIPHASGRGRVAAYEIMVSTPAISTNLAQVDGHVKLKHSLESGANWGMQTMEMSLADLAAREIILEEDAAFKAPDKNDFNKRLEANRAKLV